MNNLLIISLLINFIIICAVIFATIKGIRFIKSIVTDYKENHYQQKVSMFDEMPFRENSIVFLGDSIVEGANWDELFGKSNIINRGISGDTTEGVINRIEEIIRLQPSKLFIAVGTNDISLGVSTSQIIDNYREIIETLQQKYPQTKIFIHSLLPVSLSSKSIYKHSNRGILELNLELIKLCSKKGIEYLNIHPHFLDKNDKLKSEFTNDGLHLLGKGYLVWKEQIKEYIIN
jgi:lysophospholipase L1-like esterase